MINSFCMFVFVFYFYSILKYISCTIIQWLYNINNTLVVQYQLVQSCLNYEYIIIIIIKEEN